ncbi:50S ribosomal protein L32 [Candidatus Cyanaurora vandensis]|uniref:50S ribosomal protein L32 n=1 Tax=Candidatus Cyanaurora vandensis TaxID=2714958 RepID=UPI002579FB4C|nr:50S ribosomal protein L32 [Candidatus Cyanaurora vandensis]
MAQPKKKTSNTKRNQRRAHWQRKAVVTAEKALALGKSILTERGSFYYPVKEEAEAPAEE